MGFDPYKGTPTTRDQVPLSRFEILRSRDVFRVDSRGSPDSRDDPVPLRIVVFGCRDPVPRGGDEGE